jgi:hypothetical protein
MRKLADPAGQHQPKTYTSDYQQANFSRGRWLTAISGAAQYGDLYLSP